MEIRARSLSPLPPTPPCPPATPSTSCGHPQPLSGQAPPRAHPHALEGGRDPDRGGPAQGARCLGGGGLTADSLNGHIVPAAESAPGHFLTCRALDELMSEAAGGARGSRAGLQGGPAAAKPERLGRQSREAERCNERRRLDLWGCARASGLPARASPGNKTSPGPGTARLGLNKSPLITGRPPARSPACRGAEAVLLPVSA